MLSPTFTSREGLAGWPFTLTRPRPISSLDSPRVLKKRAPHNHFSMLTPLIPLHPPRAFSPPARPRLFKEARPPQPLAEPHPGHPRPPTAAAGAASHAPD